MKRIGLALAGLGASTLLTGCALGMGTATVDVIYRPEPVTPQPALSAIRVSVTANDERTVDIPYIGRRLDEFRGKLGPIAASRPITDVVQDALATELRLRGYTIAPDGRRVEVRVLSFYNDNRVVWFSTLGAINTGAVHLAVSVKNAGGATIYSREVAATDKRGNIGIPASTAASLSRSLQEALEQLMQDRVFLAALAAP